MELESHLEENEVYHSRWKDFVTGEYLCGKLFEDLCRDRPDTVPVWISSRCLKHVKLTEASKVFDAGVGVYLLNPLKSSYTYDDVAKEYLDGKLLPTREDLLRKDCLPNSLGEIIWTALGNYACYVAYTVLASRAPIEKAFMRQKCGRFIQEIELPLVFTLGFHGEMRESCVRGEELKNYGDKLAVSVFMNWKS